MMSYDVIVIGAGVVGSAVARELSRYQLKTAVLEKELDVACGNSSRNTGMLHAGFTYKPGSLKAECAVEGNQEFDQVAKELGVPFKRTGKLVVGFTDHDRENILKYKAIGEQNGVQGMRMIDKDEINRIDPNAGGEFAMYVPSSGILDPMQYTIGLAENACQNGVRFHFGQKVTGITRDEAKDVWAVKTEQDTFETKWVINCAGMYASEISEMLGYPNYPVKGFKGEYYVLDKKAGKFLSIPVYPAPNDKGGFSTHATPTVDGNVLVGPDSYVTEDREDYVVTKEHMDGLFRDGSKMFKQMKREYFIRNFAGIRWKRYNPETGEIYIPKEICNVQLTAEDKEVLRKGQAVYLENMINRKGEEFSAFVKLDMNTGRTMYSRTPDGFNEQQAPRIPAEVYGHVFTAQEKANLQDGKTLLVEGLKNNGQTFSSYLKVNPYSGQLQYFQENPDIRRDTSRQAAQTDTAQGQQQGQKKGAKQAV